MHQSPPEKEFSEKHIVILSATVLINLPMMCCMNGLRDELFKQGCWNFVYGLDWLVLTMVTSARILFRFENSKNQLLSCIHIEICFLLALADKVSSSK